MEKEFIPYEQALALKELGFNEPCFAGYFIETKKLWISYVESQGGEQFSKKYNISAPLYQQAFRWFREKYNLEVILCPDCLNSSEKLLREYKIISVDKSIVLEPIVDQKYWTRKGCFKTYEESELECLKKLIEIVKNGQ